MCRVLKAWHLYTRPLRYGMGKGRRNKVLKLTPAKIKYIIGAKTNNISSRIISIEMKVSIRTVNRVWGYWMKNKEPLALKKFGRPKTYLNDTDRFLILKIHKEQNCGARRLEKIIEHKCGPAYSSQFHSPGTSRKRSGPWRQEKEDAQKAMDQIRTEAQLVSGSSWLAH